MKYILISVFAILLATGISVLIVLLINRKHRIKNWLKAIIIPISSIILMICFCLSYFIFHYSASDNAKSYLKSDDVVNLNINNDWYHFDNKTSDENAIIFYSGGKVDPVSYAPLCNKIAHEGIDVYILKMPLYFPLLNINGADKVINSNKHNNYYLMGHSLGGTTASLYIANGRSYYYRGIIFLASYPSKKIDDSLKCLSIYGTNDKVLNKVEYQKNINNFPVNFEEVVINGGNHSNFGDYGFQRGDGVSNITNEEQANITKEAICDFIS